MSELTSLVRNAWHSRAAFHADPETDCYRIFHGYSEGLPGLSVDRYGTAAVINKKVEGVDDVELAAALCELFPFERIVVKAHQRVDAARRARVSFLKGSPSPVPHKVKEHGIYYFADLDDLHSNGLFLDARPARRWLRAHSQARRVYNLFSHTGSLGVAAMVGGAREVVHVDKSQAALDKVMVSYEFNGLRRDGRAVLKGDLYYHMPRAIKWGQKFQGIILDPPPFIAQPFRTPDHKPSGQDFTTLIDMACKLLAPGGWLLCIFHDFNKSHDECDAEITDVSRGILRPVWRDKADADFPETEPNRWTRMSVFTSEG
jgi:23S rRNA (cytosine1962-C5)-methyltransferase